MNIKKIDPQGFCGGVINALKIANNALENKETLRPIYILGEIIHNDIVCKALEEKGAIILNNKSRLDMLDEINKGTVIITAHGVSDDVINKAKQKNLNIIDTTCRFVNVVANNIKSKLNTHNIIYFGSKGHPESEGVLGISNKITLITTLEELKQLDFTKKYYITNQTTLSLLKLKEMYDYIKANFKDYEIDNKICLATTKRQESVLNSKADLIIVVGDKKSSNTIQLHNLAKSITNSIFIQTKDDLNINDLKKYKNIEITSGASTPSYLVDDVINLLERD